MNKLLIFVTTLVLSSCAERSDFDIKGKWSVIDFQYEFSDTLENNLAKEFKEMYDGMEYQFLEDNNLKISSTRLANLPPINGNYEKIADSVYVLIPSNYGDSILEKWVLNANFDLENTLILNNELGALHVKMDRLSK